MKEKQDAPSVTPDGRPLAALPAGVSFREAPTHLDDRGWVVEAFDPRWGWHPDPFAFAYVFSIRPGRIKGWGIHLEHEDRYFILSGHMRVVMFDERADSPTRGLVAEVVLSETNRRLMNIPAGIWHADENLSSSDVIVVNFPTMAYRHDAPDKYRLPLDSNRIPFRFEDRAGW